ncbi:MAG TPA: hypothetical protein VGM33_08090 [Baekduia sp.]|jgi:hypothetical protein
MNPVHRAVLFFGLCSLVCAGLAIYGVVRPALVIGVLGAGGLPISLWLVRRGLRMEPPRTGDRPTGAGALAWWLLPVLLIGLFLINFAAAADPGPSRVLVVCLEVAAVAAGGAYVARRRSTS